MKKSPFGGGAGRMAAAAALAALASAAVLSTLLDGRRVASAAQDAAPGLPGQRVEKMAVVFADAPVRSALELVFDSARFDYSIDGRVSGATVSLDTRRDGALPAIDLLTRLSAPGGFTWGRNGEGVYVVRPLEGVARPAPAVPPAGPVAERKEPRSERDVPRRVCGILFGGNGAPVRALLETGTPGPGAVIDIVDRGDRVASGLPRRGADGPPPVTVSEVRADGVHLTDSHGRRVVVPLRKADKPAGVGTP